METITVFCVNHICKDNKNCARYARNNNGKRRITLTKRFKGDREMCDKFIMLD